MRVRIQPKPLEIPEDDPFANDLLGREEPIKILTHRVSNIEGPCVMAVDAPWGAGKTTFINLWCQYLQNTGFHAVKFNAWENDFTNDPLIALVEELASGFKGKKFYKFKKAFKKAGAKLIKQIASGGLRYVTWGAVGLEPLEALYENLKGNNPSEEEIEKRLKAYTGAKSAMKKFRQALERMVSSSENKSVKKSTAGEAPQDSATSEGTRPGPLIVIIDELDRCRPSYAVELLEVAKHLFSVDNIVFVLAVNRRQLAHSIKALYGEAFDAEDYLRRFFDVDVRLPEPNRKVFIKNLFKSMQSYDHFKKSCLRWGHFSAGFDQELERNFSFLDEFSKVFGFSLRQIEQAVHRVGLVLASMPGHQLGLLPAVMLAVILRTINVQLYYDFIGGSVSDLDVVNEIFKGKEELRWTGAVRRLEAVLICAAKEIARHFNKSLDNSHVTELHGSYDNRITAVGVKKAEKEHSKAVLDLMGKPYQDKISGFMVAVERLELLAGALGDDGSTFLEG